MKTERSDQKQAKSPLARFQLFGWIIFDIDFHGFYATQDEARDAFLVPIPRGTEDVLAYAWNWCCERETERLMCTAELLIGNVTE